ncbi:MAG: sigma-70 family RNA polymerase sigma factor [Tannerella sp.]|jgi:RNA polymerase sigma-70 factor (ECF subfamily)|nr:sigma-70 family RNA polymerase sigma factor [Tannerella sp.]
MDGERFKTDIIPLRPVMLAVALKMLGDADDAEDAVQEIMLRIWEMRAQVTKMINPEGYVMQSLRNFCLDRLRAKKQTVEVTQISLACDETPYLGTERRNAVVLVGQIIASLPRQQKMVIEMRDIEGYELEEIATATGMQVGAVAVNLSRARKKVRDLYLWINNYKKI